MKTVLGTMTFAGQADAEVSLNMLEIFGSHGGTELDSAYLYNDGRTEELLGKILGNKQDSGFLVATKVNPWNDEGLQPGQVRSQFETSLHRLRMPAVDLLYLHSPDLSTPIVQTLEQCQQLYEAGRFKRLGLSNYAAWQVAEIAAITRTRGWVKPTVYQGMYNALTRDVEPELFPCLRNFGISFYAYNPLAGGMLTGKHRRFESDPDPGRFADNASYLERYWKEDYFGVMDQFVRVCEEFSLSPAQAALRWLARHSAMSTNYGDAIILGASNAQQLEQNLSALVDEDLPGEVLEVLDQGWESVRADCFRYFRT